MIDAIYEAAKSYYDIITPIIKSCNLIEQVLKNLLNYMIKNPSFKHDPVKILLQKHLQAFFTMIQLQQKDEIRNDWYEILNTALKIVYFGDNLTFKTLKIPSETGDQTRIEFFRIKDLGETVDFHTPDYYNYEEHHVGDVSKLNGIVF